MNFEKRTYKLTGITQMLGGQPSDPEIYSKYIASKAEKAEHIDHEARLAKKLGEENLSEKAEDDMPLTVFLRDDEEGNMILLDYMLRGFFKSSLEALEEVTGVKMPKSKVDKYLHVQPRVIPLLRGGEPIFGEDGIYERTLRANVMGREMTCLTASEMIEAPWEITFSVMLIPNKTTKSSNALSFDHIEQALDLGEFQGIGQWRNGGNGRFTWVRID